MTRTGTACSWDRLAGTDASFNSFWESAAWGRTVARRYADAKRRRAQLLRAYR